MSGGPVGALGADGMMLGTVYRTASNTNSKTVSVAASATFRGLL